MNNWKNILTGANDAYFEQYQKNLDLGNDEDVKFCSEFIQESLEEDKKL